MTSPKKNVDKIPYTKRKDVQRRIQLGIFCINSVKFFSYNFRGRTEDMFTSLHTYNNNSEFILRCFHDEMINSALQQ